jgi:CubicO group peptidase (beta-lactamase class C family)
LRAAVAAILNRHPAVGLALGVIRNGSLDFFYGHGCADIASGTPVTEDTVFRICSLSKVFTALAVMQLWELGKVDLDAPANTYLRAYQLLPARASFRPATVRHLLTHTAGIPDVLRAADLLHPSWGKFEARPAAHSVKVGEPLPSLAECYGPSLRVKVEPGTAFLYSNHGFATLGQLVEDVSGMPLDRYFRAQIFAPLGMADTDIVRTARVASRLATGYGLGPSGAEDVTDREWVTQGASNVYSTSRDMARFVVALLGGGATEHGAILRPTTLATIFAPHYQPDPRLPGIGLGLFRYDVVGHRVVGHEGRMPGFNAQLFVAPDDDLGVIAFTNGSSGAMFWLPAELERLLHHLLGVPGDVARTDIPHHPEIWNDICGRYGSRAIDARGRMMLGGGVQVFVRGGQLMLRLLSPIPALYRGMALLPDDERDPYVFRLDLSPFGMPTARIVFSREVGVGTAAVHTDLGLLSFRKHTTSGAPRWWITGAAGALAVAAAATARGARRGPNTRVER